MPQTITKIGDVLRFTTESESLSPGKLEPFIFPYEEKIKRSLFGYDFWQLLEDDLIDTSGSTIWISSKTYSADDFVDYYGLILKSLQDGNTINPCEDDGSFWVEVDKFSTSCYQQIWDRYLKYYFSWMVTAEVIEHITYPAGGKGIVTWKDDNSGVSSAPYQLVKSRQASLVNKAEMVLENMKAWMIKVNGLETTDSDYCDFSEARFIKTCDSLPVIGRGRRIITRKTKYI